MRARWNQRLPVALGAAALVLTLAGCSSSSDGGPVVSAGAVPAFTLQDVNPSSPTSGRPVLVRSYLDNVSAWYFAHAT